MTHIDFTPTPISVKISSDHNPFWSVMIPTYNREEYLRLTLKSVLNQDPGEEFMQICVADNATSTFSVKNMIFDLAGDRIKYFRHAINIGGIRNINWCIQNSLGRYVHVIHDDDIVLPGFYETMARAIRRHPEGSIFAAPVIGIDEKGAEIGFNSPPPSRDGVIENFLIQQALANRVPTQTIVVPRHIYERVGGYAEGLVFTPDWEMAFRAASVGYAVAAAELPLAASRWHKHSDSARIIRGRRHVVEMKATVDELVSRLPLTMRSQIGKNIYQFPAQAALHYASVLTAPGEVLPRIKNLLYAFWLEPTLSTLRLLSKELVNLPNAWISQKRNGQIEKADKL